MTTLIFPVLMVVTAIANGAQYNYKDSTGATHSVDLQGMSGLEPMLSRAKRGAFVNRQGKVDSIDFQELPQSGMPEKVEIRYGRAYYLSGVYASDVFRIPESEIFKELLYDTLSQIDLMRVRSIKNRRTGIGLGTMGAGLASWYFFVWGDPPPYKLGAMVSTPIFVTGLAIFMVNFPEEIRLKRKLKARLENRHAGRYSANEVLFYGDVGKGNNVAFGIRASF